MYHTLHIVCAAVDWFISRALQVAELSDQGRRVCQRRCDGSWRYDGARSHVFQYKQQVHVAMSYEVYFATGGMHMHTV